VGTRYCRGCTTLVTGAWWCDPCKIARGKPPKTTTARGLGSEHQQRRKQLLPPAIGTPCPIQGPTCDRIMRDPKRMHLDHSRPRALGGTVGDRIVCMPCNTGRGAALGNRLRAGRVPRTRPPDRTPTPAAAPARPRCDPCPLVTPSGTTCQYEAPGWSGECKPLPVW
jgi:hypothetical protein